MPENTVGGQSQSKTYEVEFSPSKFVAAPANTHSQRLGFGNVWLDDYEFDRQKEDEIEIEYKEGEHLRNPKVIEALKELAKKLGADRIRITGGDRTRAEHERLRKLGETNTAYENTQHGSYQGYTAADVRFFIDGKQIDPDIVADTASQMDIYGGVGYYDTFTHVDLRPRDLNGEADIWDKRR